MVRVSTLNTNAAITELTCCLSASSQNFVPRSHRLQRHADESLDESRLSAPLRVDTRECNNDIRECNDGQQMHRLFCKQLSQEPVGSGMRCPLSENTQMSQNSCVCDVCCVRYGFRRQLGEGEDHMLLTCWHVYILQTVVVQESADSKSPMLI